MRLRTRIFEFYPTYKCAKCGYEWMPRNPRPRKCPKCSSARWFTLEVAEPPANRKYSSLVELARAMGISSSQIYRVRLGQRPINEKFITGALKAFPGYKLGELFYVADGSDDSEVPWGKRSGLGRWHPDRRQGGLTAGDVAQLLGLHPNTVRRWSKKGILKSYRIGSRGDRRFRWEDIDSIVKEG